MVADPGTNGLTVDMRTWISGVLHDYQPGQIVAEGGVPSRLLTDPQVPVVLIQAMGGLPEEADLAKRRLQIRVVAQTYFAARQQFERVRQRVLAYPYLVLQAAPSFDLSLDLPGGTSKPTHGADFYVTVPYMVPA